MDNLLTDREKQILQMIANGLTNKSISEALLIELSTVENHTHKIYGKLNVSSRSQAVAYAFQTRLISLNKNE